MDKTQKVKRIFALLMIFTGLLVLSYPFISQYLDSRNATEIVRDYQEEVQQMDQVKIDTLKDAARSYNAQLGKIETANEAGEGKKADSYINMIDVGAAMGYITIPRIDVNLPIYEGTSDEVLSQGIGHLKETSYPLGGASTHSALSGHRGLAEKELFTNLDQMKRGDEFYLHILDEVLAYEVDQIKVVEPNDIADLAVTEGEDLCTLVTCTPLGINSHRLLVRGHRVEYTGEEKDPSDSLYQSVHTGTVIRRLTQIWPWMILAFVLMIGVEIFLMITILRRIKTRMEDD